MLTSQRRHFGRPFSCYPPGAGRPVKVKKLMKIGFKQIILSTVFAGLAIPAALAQTPGNPFERGRYTAVTERRQADFDPEPLRAGAFEIWGSLGLDAAYNDNVFAEATGPDDDTIIHVRPVVEARSNWTSHALTAGVSVNHREYVANDAETSTDYEAFLDGRLDVQRSFALTGNVNAGHFTEERYLPGNDAFDPAAEFDAVGASVGAIFRSDRIQIEGNVNTAQRDFDPELYDFRDVTETGFYGRASYAVSPDVAIFVQGRTTDQDYDFPGDAQNPNRDGTQTNLQVGASFELQAPFRGEIAIGSVQEEKDDPVWTDVDGLSVNARLMWFPTQITTVTFRGNQGVFDPGVIEFASAKNTNYGVRVDHELRRNIIIFGDVGFGKYEFEGTPTSPAGREDEFTDLEAGIAYKINKRIHFEFGYRLHSQDSTVEDSFDQNIISAGLKFYP